MNQFHLTYFSGSKPVYATAANSELTLDNFARRIRGLRDTGGQGSLPGPEGHAGAILVREVFDIELHEPGKPNLPHVVLILPRKELP